MSLCSSREVNELQVQSKIAAQRKRGLSQLDHLDLESNCHRRPFQIIFIYTSSRNVIQRKP